MHERCSRLLSLTIIVMLGMSATGALGQDGEPAPKADGPAKKQSRKKDELFRVDGQLTAASKVHPTRKDGRYQEHKFKMTPGKSYIIEMRDKNALTMDPYLLLLDSAGKVLMENDDIQTGIERDARIIFNPVKEDDYTIVATTCLGNAYGKYTLTVRTIAQGAAATVIGGTMITLIPTTYEDVSITPLLPWGWSNNSGNSGDLTHGYVEYRFLIENDSETTKHRVGLTLPRSRGIHGGFGHYLSALRKSVDVGPGDALVVSLFQPDLRLTHGNDVSVEIDGRPQDQAVSVNVMANRGTRTGGMGFGPRPSPGEYVHLLVPSGDLHQKFSNNIFKTAVGVVTKPPTGGYSSIGGTYQGGGPFHGKPYQYYGVNRFQQSPEAMSQWSKRWLGYSSFDGVCVDGAALNAAPADVQAALWQYVECGGALLVVGAAKLPESWQRHPTQPEHGFTSYYPGFGQCLVATKADPLTHQVDIATWDPDDWRFVARMWENPRNAWNQVRSPTEANKEFEIVKGLAIPVRGLFISMILFVALIGPVNVMWLSRTKRRLWMLWTVPVFSLVTCLMLVGYMAATEGWHGYVRADGITVLDEASQRASTIGWQGFYSPSTPAGGLHFSDDTELTPHLSLTGGRYSGNNRQAYAIDWSVDQNLTDGWLSAKVPMHFLVRRSEKRLERVTVRKNNDGSLALVNGLGADISTLWLADTEGRLHQAEAIRAGAEASLTATQITVKNTPDALNKLFGEHWLRAAKLLTDSPGTYLRPGCYLAVLDESPFWEPGLRRTQSRQLRSVVYGILKDQ